MPYHIEHHSNVYQVKKDSDGKVMGTHKTKRDAQAQLYALYKSEKK